VHVSLSPLIKSKVKFHPRTGNKGAKTEKRYISLLSLTTALEGVGLFK
jgi:hypothetical protein